ncbi:MAG TPA: hypothetical protein VF411_07135, partial [Bacteroidia bacterium]
MIVNFSINSGLVCKSVERLFLNLESVSQNLEDIPKNHLLIQKFDKNEIKYRKYAAITTFL